MKSKPHPPLLRYGFAVVSIAGAIWVRLLLDPVMGNTLPYATLFVAILLTAWYGGLRPAMVAVVLGALAADYFLLPPRGRLIWADLDVQVGLLLFLATGLGIALLGGAMHAAKQRAETTAAAMREANEQLEARVLERTAELSRTNDSIRTSEARMGGIVNSAMDAIISVDRKQHIVVFNAGAEKMFHCSAAKAMGQSLDLFIPARFREQHQRHVEGFGKTGVTSRSMHLLSTLSGLRTDGEEFPVEASISQVEVGGEKIFTVILRDLTERSRAEEALQASEIRYRRLFESAKDGILILDAASGQIIDVNPFLTDILGFSKEELVGKELWETGAFADLVGSKAAFVELQQQEHIRYEDLPFETRGGIVWQVEFVSNSYLAGRTRVIQCNIRDITERKQAEEALRETNRNLEQALEELHGKTQELTTMTQQLWQASKLATMGELAASIAHELNNPLATMALRAELLVEKSLDGSSRTSAQIILSEIERMAGLVESLLQFSRRRHRQISPVDVAEEISNSANFISYYLRNRRIRMVKEFAADVPTIQADREQLRQLFLNLLTNAADAMPDGGTLIIRTVPAEFGESKSVLIEFVDSGVGIPETDLERIWDSFFTTKPEGKGTGLGMAICRRIVEEHGGTIAIDSKVGEGTSLRITLPATANGVHEMKPEEVPAARETGHEARPY